MSGLPLVLLFYQEVMTHRPKDWRQGQVNPTQLERSSMLYIITMVSAYGFVFGACLFICGVFYHLWLLGLQPQLLPASQPSLTRQQRERLYAGLNRQVKLGFILIIVVGGISSGLSGLAPWYGSLVPDVVMILASTQAVRSIRRQVRLARLEPTLH